ncbi:hypothetical protein BGX26_010920 [Mortierella sp. AD094]|nr:hypothetical protein BGX26_010920 [Mortierella sp. AD094]
MKPKVQHPQSSAHSHYPTSQTPSGIALSVINLCVTLVSRPAVIPRVYKQIFRQLRKLRKRAQTVLNIESSCQESNDIDDESNNKNSDRSLLRNVNFRVDPGQGGSGFGKTTLLNVITGNMNKRHAAISGDILFNGGMSKTCRKNGLIRYLQQEDHLLPFITVRETLRFAADLRLPTLTKQKKEELIESLILELGLKDCADTRVGDAHDYEAGQGGIRGISGGERRRVSAAIQLLTRPNLLVCDEVTPGLDAFTALELVKTLILGLEQCPEHMNPLDYALDNCDSVPSNSVPGLPESAVAGGIGETDPQTNTSCSIMAPSNNHTMRHACNSDAKPSAPYLPTYLVVPKSRDRHSETTDYNTRSLALSQARLWRQVMALCNHRQFDCPYEQSQIKGGAIVEAADLARCSLWDVYTIAAWAVLSMLPVDHLHSTSNQSPIEYVLRLILCLFYNKESSSTKPNVEGKKFKARKDDGPAEARNDIILRINEEEKRQRQSVTIVKDLSLFVAQSPNLWLQHTVQKPLLQSISFEVPAAQLTAILGGSGSGKVSLILTVAAFCNTFVLVCMLTSMVINALLHRSPSRVSGEIYFNGVKTLPKNKINAICGYVRQDDGFLMSHLTIRETLRYAAELGMKKSLPITEKWQKAEEIMDLIGLCECADVMVGGEGISGYSGGQRALSVIQALKRIAKSGITVICAIHQPRVDIWNELDNILLLMTGGRLAYAGKADEALGYFEQAGYILPKHMNPPEILECNN